MIICKFTIYIQSNSGFLQNSVAYFRKKRDVYSLLLKGTNKATYKTV